MISTDVTLEDITRQKVLNGARAVYEAVKSTYSPQSGNVAIEKNWGKPVVSHDGITVARAIRMVDPVENVGAQYAIEASNQTNMIAGDGTSATIILFYHLLERAEKLRAAGHNPMAMRRGMTKASAEIQELITKKAVEVSGDDLEKVAIISAGSEATGQLIADTIKKVGYEGGVGVEEYGGVNIEQEIVEGFYWNQGFTHPYMMNEPHLRRAFYEDMFVMVIEKKLKDPSDVKQFLQIMDETEQRRCLIVGNIEGAALEALLVNKQQGNLDPIVVPPVAMGNMRSEFFEDVATQTGAKLIPSGFEMSELTYEHLGFAKKVIVHETNTTIIEGSGDKDKIKTRLTELRKVLKTVTDSNQVEKLQDRIAKLNGKIGIIKVGAPTEIDRKELLLRVEDAVFATKAAKAEGIVAGGGTTLAKLSTTLSTGYSDSWKDGMTEDEQAGYRLVFDTLVEPFKQLMHNAGLQDVGYHLHMVTKDILKKSDKYGYNVKKMSDEPIDLFEAGVIDPAKVIKQVVENSCSMAGIALTTNAAITINRQDMKDFPNER